MNWVWVLALIAGIQPALVGQTVTPVDFHDLSLTRDSLYRMRSEAFESSVYRYMSSLQGVMPQAERSVLTIPVVVHIMHLPTDLVPDDGSSNLSDKRAQDAIRFLNDAFRNSGAFTGGPQYSNAGIPAADVEIDFCLAQIDENGNPVSGINRVPTPLSDLMRDADCGTTGYSQDVCLKNLSRWDPTKYLNIWVVNSICTDVGGDCQINGYSFMPGAHGSLVDGIVIEAEFFGASAEKNTELVHEAGHYLGLFNTYYQPSIAPNSCSNSNCLAFGDGICDTPPDNSRSALECSLGERENSCSSDADDTSPNNPFDSDVEDLYENFMDDGAAICRNSFTPMQKVRMRFALTTERQSLLLNQACATTFENVGFGEWVRPPVITCDSLIRPLIQVYNNGEEIITSIQFRQQVDQYQPTSWTWTGVLLPGDTMVLDLPAKFLPEGRHAWEVKIGVINGVGPDDDEADNFGRLDFFRLPGQAPVTDYPFCEDVELGLYQFGQVNWDGQVGFDFFSWADCLGTTGKYVLRYNSSGAWEGGAGLGAGPSGTTDMLFSRPYDLSEYNDATFSFVSAWKESYPENSMGLKVYVLPDCESLPELVYEQSADQLESSNTPFNPNIISWQPAGCDEWMSHEISLRKYAGKTIRVLIEVELEAEFTQNFYLDNFCMDATNTCPLPVAIPERAGVFLADTACTSPDGWTHFIKYAGTAPRTSTDVLLFSVLGLDSSQVQLNAEGVSMVVTPKFGQGGYDMSAAPYVKNSEGWFVAGRYWSLSPSAGADSLRVRIYFSEKDLEDLRKAGANMPVGTPPLTVFRIGTDPDPERGHSDVIGSAWGEFSAESLASGASAWKMEEMNGYFASEFVLGSWDGLGFGVSGDGKGLGPTYPGDLTILDARQQQGQVRLSWSVPRELFAEGYQIWRRQADQADFAQIGEVPSKGNNWETQVYSFHDPSPYEGPAEYYISMTHELPLMAYSDTVSVSYDLRGLVRAYPNPTAGMVWLLVDTETSEPVHAAIYNAGWQLMREKSWRNNPGEELPFDLSNVPPGVYFYVVRFMRNGELFEVRGKILRNPEG